MRILHLAGATSVSDPVHGEAQAGPDGVFDLPHPFAEHLLTTAAGTWRGEAEHISLLARNALEELRDPRVALRVLSDLRERVASLETTVADLTGRLAAHGETPEAPTSEAAPEQSPTPETTPAEQPELTPAQKAAATRAANKAAAKTDA
jgi:hypothetical protein